MNNKIRLISLVLVYLFAIILANITVTYFGPAFSLINAFIFIGLDFTTRDVLHELWKNNRLWLKMFGLILLGGIISFILNRNTLNIAIASCIAFAAAGTIDAISYQMLHKKNYLVKVNGSNIFSAMADSIIFPTLAFGMFMPLIILGQFAAKIFGGFLWSLALKKMLRK